jgi:hypothetical protein
VQCPVVVAREQRSRLGLENRHRVVIARERPNGIQRVEPRPSFAEIRARANVGAFSTGAPPDLHFSPPPPDAPDHPRLI